MLPIELPKRKALPKAEWQLTVVLDIEGAPPVEFGTLRYSDSWAAANPLELGRVIGRYIYEQASKKVEEQKRLKSSSRGRRR